MPRNSAGMLFFSGGRILLIQRSDEVDESGTWGIPGGGAESYENNALQTALRETKEEIGFVPKSNIVDMHVRKKKSGKEYVTYIARVKSEFYPILNRESSDWAWVSIRNASNFNLHPGLEKTLLELYR